MPSALVLTLNGGSSSWKSTLLEPPAPDACAADAIAAAPYAQATLTWHGSDDAARMTATSGPASLTRDIAVARVDAATVLIEAYRELGCDLSGTVAVGHRIVHGGPHFHESVRIDDTVLARLREVAAFAPAHNPVEIAGILAATEALPGVPQIAAFDTAFHRTLPIAAYAYGGPYEWLARDIRRYGFHGINVAYCVERASELLARTPQTLRLIVAHLGGGCSVTAVREGASIDTTMGFTPLDGILMGTRSGGIDPGILLFLLRDAPPGTTAAEAAETLDETLNRRAGLSGLSGLSSDVRELLTAQSAGNARAALALDSFVHRLAAAIASFLPALGGLDALIFTGGIGEHAAVLRERVCARLAICGAVLDTERNSENRPDGDISVESSSIRVLVIAAGEDWTIARDCVRVLQRRANGYGANEFSEQP